MRRSPILCLLALSGCATMEPHYLRPDHAVPAAFPIGPASPAPGTGQPWADIGWHDFFVDPRLEQVIAASLQYNRNLRIAIANVEVARAQYRIQRSALVPQIGGAGEAAYGRGTAGPTGGHPDLQGYSLSVGVSSYELDLWGRVRSLNKEALEQYLATDEARRSTEIGLVSEVATAWLTLGADRASLQVSRTTAVSAGASLALARQRFAGGITSELDVRQAETLVEQVRGDIADLVTLVDQDRNALTLLVGAPVPDALLPGGVDETPPLSASLPANLGSEVLTTRPDVLAAEHRLRASNFDIGAARAAFFPTISLTGAAGLASASLGKLFTGGAFNWSVGPSISLPFLDGGRRRATLDQARAQKNVEVATYEGTVQTAFREVADALARRGTIDEKVAAADALVATARSSLSLSTDRYRNGTDSYLTVLVAQQTLYGAQGTLITARLTRSTNTVTLYQVLGGGLRP